MLLRDHYYSANKWRIVEIKKFSIGTSSLSLKLQVIMCPRCENDSTRSMRNINVKKTVVL